MAAPDGAPEHPPKLGPQQGRANRRQLGMASISPTASTQRARAQGIGGQGGSDGPVPMGLKLTLKLRERRRLKAVQPSASSYGRGERGQPHGSQLRTPFCKPQVTPKPHLHPGSTSPVPDSQAFHRIGRAGGKGTNTRLPPLRSASSSGQGADHTRHRGQDTVPERRAPSPGVLCSPGLGRRGWGGAEEEEPAKDSPSPS